ncbi:MAG: oligopeptide transporter, OPT family [Euryarchaeota archaeon]|jgi:putative OPT family oligopeptide transporter|nr:oligopeptide transporter, OPT family [Euryarchaeota archaeon]MBT5594780.1 oligopeptide transporter, OPT family [Euryarchaeota archaeon]MBT6844909.1 oligopeptide transporter, OPT family [Euryarchaeota archaeon]MBT7064625.1 oligopeptide transporter, OPT family [Euryarchaeota archaeon]MBT7263707.1 oligopeptide transporter, OPT family [Euryarchaeota archaeon]
MSALGEPYIPASESPKELTPRVIIVGIILGILMTAANAYLGLYAGMTVSASIPAAVMSMIILRTVFDDVSILENNAVQTMASAGESLAAGVIFTVPALLVIGIWDEIQWLDTMIIAILGGLLGTMFTIALRRLFIVEEALPYPEGVACREVLVAGEEGGEGALAILYALGIGAVYGLMVKGFKVTHHSVESAVEFLGTRLYAGMDLSIALLSVGYIVGIRIASFIFLGGVIGFGILVPMYGLINGWPNSPDLVTGFYSIWASEIRYVGVGAMVVGGVYTLWSMRKTIFTGLSKALVKKEQSDELILRTEIDLPLDKVLLVCGGLVGLTFLYYWWATGSLILALAGALFLGVVSFFFAAVAGYIAGVVGSSNSPVSGMTIATLLFTVALVWVVGDFFLKLGTEELMLATLLIAAIVASSAAIAGDVMQDLKTGHMVGATPWRQQIAEIIGVLTGAVIIGPTLQLLHKAFRISKTACEINPLPDDPTCSNALFAPQAELIGAIVQGAFGGDLNIQMVMLGAIIAVALIMLKMPVMSVAIGIYLPLGLSVPIMLGGIISYFALNSAYLRIDGHLNGEPSIEAQKAAKDVENRGVLIGAGFIAGESILGVFIAILIVLDMKLNIIFGVTTLNDIFSLLFFGWFVAVFIWLATRALPKGGNLLTESVFIIRNIATKFIGSFKLQNWK